MMPATRPMLNSTLRFLLVSPVVILLLVGLSIGALSDVLLMRIGNWVER